MNSIPGFFQHCDINTCVASTENCLSSVGNTLERVIDKIAHVFVRVIVWIAETAIMLGALALKPVYWLLDKSVDCLCSGDVSYQGVILNHSAFHLAPEPMNLHTLVDHGENVNVADLITAYREVFGLTPDNKTPAALRHDDDDLGRIASLVVLAQETITFPVEGGDNYEHATRNANYNVIFLGTLKKVLQNLIVELRNSTIPVEKKKRALKALADSGNGGCRPRRLEESLRQYRLLRSTAPEMSNLLLGYIQDLKEEILLTAFQGRQFHVINYVRRQVGEMYGLNTSEVNMQDPHINMGDPPFDLQIRYVFHTQYTTERLVQGVKHRIHLDENNQVWLDYMHNQLRSDAIARGENPDDEAVQDRMLEDVMSFFDRPQITDKGVIYLLKSQGIVVSA